MRKAIRFSLDQKDQIGNGCGEKHDETQFHFRYCSAIHLDGELVQVFPYFHCKMRVWEEKGRKKLELLPLNCIGIKSSQHCVAGGICYLEPEEKYSTRDI